MAAKYKRARCRQRETPCSRPSAPLRAACRGGLRPVLTATARGALPKLGRDGETPFNRTEKLSAVRCDAKGEAIRVFLRIRAASFNQEHDRRFPQSTKTRLLSRRGRITSRFISTAHELLNPSAVQGTPRRYLAVRPAIQTSSVARVDETLFREHLSGSFRPRLPPGQKPGWTPRADLDRDTAFAAASRSAPAAP